MIRSNIKGQRILITGGTGSFGHQYVKQHGRENSIVVYSRDEMKQWNMQNAYDSNFDLKFIMGDVRDRDRLKFAMRGIDIVIHAAATKIVPLAEDNPSECLRTNVLGAENVISAVASSEVKSVVALSTDKASSPINFYGAAKLMSDKLFVNAAYGILSDRNVNVVRYGNVMGSRGSVIPYFIQQAKTTGYLTVTDPKMTRFMIKLSEAVGLVDHVLSSSKTGCVFVQKIPSMTLYDIATSIVEPSKLRIIGARAGEKIHEQMIGLEDAPYTFETSQYYYIKSYKEPSTSGDELSKRVEDGFRYSSEINSSWMSKLELTELISNGYFDTLP